MNFKPALAAAIITGDKWVTRRPVSENPRSPYHPDRAPKLRGKRIAVCPGRGKSRICTVEVISIDREAFEPMSINPTAVHSEGFTSASAFWGAWADMHGSLAPVDVWRIEFELVDA